MIGTFNLNGFLEKELSSKIETIDMMNNQNKKVDALIINWLAAGSGKDSLVQIEILNNMIKKIPIVIIDDGMSIKHKEYKWLSKFNVKLFEPAVRNRDFFDFLPDPIEKCEIKRESVENKSYRIGYKGKIHEDFEKFFGLLKTKYDISVNCSPENLTKEKIEFYRKSGIDFNDFSWSDVSHTIVIGSKGDYETGKINSKLLDKMKYGCVPFIPNSHRFFGSMTEMDIEDYNDVFYFCGYNSGIRWIMINDIYKRIERYYPEFLAETQFDIIMDFLKREG